MTNTPKRFIAGAVCPQCKQMDKIVFYQRDDESFHECVQCGYKDKLTNQAEHFSSPAPVNDPTQAIKVIKLVNEKSDKRR